MRCYSRSRLIAGKAWHKARVTHYTGGVVLRTAFKLRSDKILAAVVTRSDKAKWRESAAARPKARARSLKGLLWTPVSLIQSTFYVASGAAPNWLYKRGAA